MSGFWPDNYKQDKHKSCKNIGIQNTSEYHLQLAWTSILLWYLGITNTSIFQDSRFLWPSIAPYLQLSQSHSHQRLDTGTPTEDMLRSHRLPWRCLPLKEVSGLGKVSSSENPSYSNSQVVFLGGGRNSTHTVQLKAMFLFLGPYGLFKKLQWMGWRHFWGY